MFQEVVFDGWTPEQVRAVPSSDGSHSAEVLDDGPKGLPPGARQLFAIGWAAVHGFVMLEVHGHLMWLEESGETTCRAMLESYAETVERARTRS